MQLNLIVLTYYCSLVFLLGFVCSSETGDETLQYFEAPKQKTHHAELADDSYGNGILDDRNKRSSTAFTDSLAKAGSDSGELLSNGYLYGRPSSAFVNSLADANNNGDIYGSANAQASALSSGYGYAPKVSTARHSVITSAVRAPPTVPMIPYTVGENGYGFPSSSDSLAQGGSYGLNSVDLGSLWPGFETPVSYNYGNALGNANNYGYERLSSRRASSNDLASSQGYQVPVPRYISASAPYVVSPSVANSYAGENSYEGGNVYSSSSDNVEPASLRSTLNNILGSSGAGNWEVYEAPAPSSSQAPADAAANGYGDAQTRAIEQVLGRRFLGGLGGGYANAYPNPINAYVKPVFPPVYPSVYPSVYQQAYPAASRRMNSYPIYRPRPVYPVVENAYPILPGIVAPRNPKTIFNPDAVAQKDGMLKAVIEAMQEARRRSGNRI